MKEVKILQCGDLHFDTPFKELSNKLALISKEELLEVFNKIIDICEEELIDIFLLSGDIFDNLTVNKKTLSFIKNQLQRIPMVRVFISPGNHDPYHEKSFYKMIDWPENVHIFKGEIEKVFIEELQTVVWGAGFNFQHVKKSLLKGIEAVENYINIAVIHGDISNVEGGNEYNPITLKEIGESNVDYIALGHRHGYSGILRERNTCYAYSGCPQGRGFDELGDKGIIIGKVSKGAVDLRFSKTSKRNYYVEKINVTDSVGYEEIKFRILDSIDKEKREKNLYKINLIGELDGAFNLKEEIVLDKIKEDFYFVKIVDNTEVKLDYTEIARDFSVRGIFVKKLLEQLEDAEESDKEIIKMAIKLGMQCLSEEEVKIDDY
ncbi:metallophosphoesterase family protein [Clostridium chauvoei]|uniref:Metallophosphoesterase n=2 Tax=Clostridium chauvoei TaxID=46867 RepID=A0ABD4RFU4_9CLOT|nr:metallophosphoesterase [Clostridium chauvoei]ATD55884.1 DNA repair exonuclease [Clostridium chauvoei]ATD56444.1 DNA repair exonuclease [Clostridium chauvoei]MBX7280247.1 metallophosphoesterase [Clostridium chauvoei]MBX7282643.1 metallophosphoesterase [Clostridium chauvoei]MBX7285138.1 metallophosphoesterase [Clostridium chauvoei]